MLKPSCAMIFLILHAFCQCRQRMRSFAQLRWCADLSVSGGNTKADIWCRLYPKRRHHGAYGLWTFQLPFQYAVESLEDSGWIEPLWKNITAMAWAGNNGLRCVRSHGFTRPTVPVMYSNGHYGNQDGSNISFSKFETLLKWCRGRITKKRQAGVFWR